MNRLQELERLLGDALTADGDVLEGYRRDSASWAAAGVPLALARPRNTAQVQALARWASQHRVPLVARGAGTGVAGGANAVDGCVVLSFERMNAIVELNEAAMYAVVQPGVLNGELTPLSSIGFCTRGQTPRLTSPEDTERSRYQLRKKLGRPAASLPRHRRGREPVPVRRGGEKCEV